MPHLAVLNVLKMGGCCEENAAFIDFNVSPRGGYDDSKVKNESEAENHGLE